MIIDVSGHEEKCLTSCARFNIRTIYVTSQKLNTGYYYSIGVVLFCCFLCRFISILMRKSIIYNNGKLIAKRKQSECEMRARPAEARCQMFYVCFMFELNCLSVNKMVNFVKSKNINSILHSNTTVHMRTYLTEENARRRR